MYSVGVCSRRGHTVNKCYDLTKVPVSERKAVLKSLNLCFRCLSNSKGHNFRRCTVKCFSCKGNHHALLCDKGMVNTNSQSVSQDLPTPNTTQSPNQSPAPNAYTATNMPTNAGVSHVGVTQSTVSSNTQVLLQIVWVPVRGEKGVSDAIVLFDTGADRTYVTESSVDRIGPEWLSTRTIFYMQPLVVIHLVRRHWEMSMISVYRVLIIVCMSKLQRSLASVLLYRGLLFLTVSWVPWVKVFNL